MKARIILKSRNVGASQYLMQLPAYGLNTDTILLTPHVSHTHPLPGIIRSSYQSTMALRGRQYNNLIMDDFESCDNKEEVIRNVLPCLLPVEPESNLTIVMDIRRMICDYFAKIGLRIEPDELTIKLMVRGNEG